MVICVVLIYHKNAIEQLAFIVSKPTDILSTIIIIQRTRSMLVVDIVAPPELISGTSAAV